MILITDTPIQFECFKAYEEDTYYTSGENVVIFRSLYHYATLGYDVGSEIPQKSIDGNYYSIPGPSYAECGDLLMEKTEIHIQDPVFKLLIDELLINSDPLELDQKFQDLGFAISSRQMMYGLGTAVIENKQARQVDTSTTINEPVAGGSKPQPQIS
jgi:hypothetical protein